MLGCRGWAVLGSRGWAILGCRGLAKFGIESCAIVYVGGKGLGLVRA